MSPHQAKTQPKAAKASNEEVAERRPAVLGVHAPAAATDDAERARTSPRGVSYPRVAVRTVPILRPLIHVSSHGVEAERIRRFTPTIFGRCNGMILEPTIHLRLRRRLYLSERVVFGF